MLKRFLPLALVLLAAASVPATGAPAGAPTPAEAKASIGHLGPVPVPPGNPLTRPKIVLGARLFSDPMLSGDGSVSCETCHLPYHGYATQEQLGPAYPSKAERRNSPTLINVAYNLPIIWDGRAGALDKQPLGSIGNVLHMNNNRDLLIEQLKVDSSYVEAFRAAFGDATITPARIGQAIGSFERTLVFDDSPLDRYMTGDEGALDAAQKRGLALFLGKANCVACHNGPNLTDNGFHNLGVPDDHVTGDPAVMASVRFDAKRNKYEGWAEVAEDPGRALITKDAADLGAFRTMGLRNIEQSSPYMHNGAFATLEEVVAFYDRGGGHHPNKSSLLQPLGLSDVEQADLVSFLKALTGKRRPPPAK
ncbi:MAG: cytochrome-c peroxidase [Kiloniellaceae bacterium]